MDTKKNEPIVNSKKVKSAILKLALDYLHEQYNETGFLGKVSYSEFGKEAGDWEFSVTNAEGSCSFDFMSPTTEHKKELGYDVQSECVAAWRRKERELNGQ